MSFYVTLPSNAVSTTNKNNTTTCYRTDFDDRILLNSNYEVGVVEVIYKLSWFLPVGSIRYSYQSNNNYEYIPIIFHDGDSIKKCIEKINITLQEYVTIKIYNERYQKYLDNETNIDPKYKKIILDEKQYPRSSYNMENKNNNLHVVDDIRKNENEFIKLPMIRYNNDELFIQFSSMMTTLKFNGQLAEILNTDENQIFSNKSDKNDTSFVKINTKERINIDEIISLVGTLYIYTDIIEHQYVGQNRMPLLRNIVIDYNTNQRTTWTHYDVPHYIKVNKTEISSILIDIRDENGNKILFDNGSLIIKLHFRPENGK